MTGALAYRMIPLTGIEFQRLGFALGTVTQKSPPMAPDLAVFHQPLRATPVR